MGARGPCNNSGSRQYGKASIYCALFRIVFFFPSTDPSLCLITCPASLGINMLIIDFLTKHLSFTLKETTALLRNILLREKTIEVNQASFIESAAVCYKAICIPEAAGNEDCPDKMKLVASPEYVLKHPHSRQGDALIFQSTSWFEYVMETLLALELQCIPRQSK